MKKIKVLIYTLFLLIAFALPASASAQGLTCAKIVVGGIYTLGSQETLDGNLCVLGGNALLNENSLVAGDVILVGGTLVINGRVAGNLNTAGGVVTLGDNCVIEGDINNLGGQIVGIEQAEIIGQVHQDLSEFSPQNFFTGWRNPAVQIFNPAWDYLNLLLRSFIWAIFGMLVALVLPKPVSRIGTTASTNLALSGGIGCATVTVVVMLILILAITILCIPLSLLGGLVLLISWSLGVISLGTELGKRIAVIAKRDWALAVSAGIGTFLLILVVNGFNLVLPCIGWVAQLAVGAIGLGAVALTRFGSQSYPPFVPPMPPSSPGTLPGLPEPSAESSESN